jgi:predicted kinase
VTGTLFIFAGLPGVGKSTLARSLAREQEAVFLRIDTIEAALRSAGANMAAMSWRSCCASADRLA